MQLIKLTRIEKSKTTSKLFFLTGGRTLQALTAALDTNRQLTGLLSVAADGFVEKVKGLQNDLRTTGKTLSNVSIALAEADTRRIVDELKNGEKVVSVHRDEVGLAYLREVADQVTAALAKDGASSSSAGSPYFLLATSGDSVGSASGVFLLVSESPNLSTLGANLATQLGGKGGGKGRFQGKATGLTESARTSAIEWLKEQAGKQ